MTRHRLAEIEVQNYRSFIGWRVVLSDFTPIVGPNNVGKSNLLDAICWVLRFEQLTAEDFHDKARPVVVTALIEGISTDVLGGMKENHKKAVEPYCGDGRLRVRRTLLKPGDPKKNCVLEVRNPAVTDAGAKDAWKANPTGIDEALQGLFPDPLKIEAMDDAAEDVSAAKAGSTIGKLLAMVTKPIEQEYGPRIRESLDAVARTLAAEGDARAPELTKIDDRASAYLEELFPGVKIRIHIAPPQIAQIFKGGSIRIQETGRSSWDDVQTQGHGAQRSVQMALIRYLAEVEAEGEGKSARRLLLIDEPELYLHPQGVEQVRCALKRLSEGGYQVIFSTHSPLMIGRAEIPETVVLHKRKGEGTRCAVRMTEALAASLEDGEHQAGVLFDLTRSPQILFTQKVVLTEGNTELLILPALYEVARSRSLASSRIGCIAVGSSGNMVKCLGILDAMGVQAVGIVDLDFMFGEAVTAGLLPPDAPCLTTGVAVLRDLATKHPFKVSAKGYPEPERGKMAMAEVWELLTATEGGKASAAGGHELLRARRIWLWRMGAIDVHLGLKSKKHNHLAEYARSLREKGTQATVKDHDGCMALLDWIDEGVADAATSASVTDILAQEGLGH